MEITIGKIVDFLSARLLEAMKNPAVFKPWSWALYRTWEWVNENEKERDIRGLLDDGNERAHHIKVLKQFLHDYQEWGEDIELEKTIKYAISSLKTDLKYDLMYEGEEKEDTP